VLLASHILAEVEALCDRVSIVRKGQTVESGSLADLRHLTRTTVIAEIDSDPSPLRSLPGIHNLKTHDHRVELEVDGDRVSDLVTSLGPLGVRSLVSHPPTLEELFMRHYEDGEHR
jgi:ABC-2 type transport system ATP-binding protein